MVLALVSTLKLLFRGYNKLLVYQLLQRDNKIFWTNKNGKQFVNIYFLIVNNSCPLNFGFYLGFYR